MKHRRKKPRTVSNGKEVWRCGSRTGEAPSWWNILFHSRPKRRRTKAKLNEIMHGKDPDGIIWDLGNRKPHNYYW